MSKITPKISVIMPFYNCEKFLDESIQSILNQTFSDFEFIIINDASTDHSDEIVKRYMKEDERIIYVKNDKNVGIVQNLNKGLEIAKGEYIARMDGDDISVTDRFEKQLKIFKANSTIDIVGTYVYTINEKEEITGEIKKPISTAEIMRNAFLFQTMNHPTILCKTKVIKKFGYREKYKKFEDTDLFTRMFLSGIRGYNIPEKLYFYRIYNNNVQTRSDRKKAIEFFQFQKEIIKDYGYKAGLKDYIFMYGYLLTGYLLSPGMQRAIQAFIKKILKY